MNVALAVLLAALEHLKQLLGAVRVDANGLQPAAEYEADVRERIVELVDDFRSVVVGDRGDAGDFGEYGLADTAEVLM